MEPTSSSSNFPLIPEVGNFRIRAGPTPSPNCLDKPGTLSFRELYHGGLWLTSRSVSSLPPPPFMDTVVSLQKAKKWPEKNPAPSWQAQQPTASSRLRLQLDLHPSQPSCHVRIQTQPPSLASQSHRDGNQQAGKAPWSKSPLLSRSLD